MRAGSGSAAAETGHERNVCESVRVCVCVCVCVCVGGGAFPALLLSIKSPTKLCPLQGSAAPETVTQHCASSYYIIFDSWKTSLWEIGVCTAAAMFSVWMGGGFRGQGGLAMHTGQFFG